MFAEGLYTACQPAQTGPASSLVSQSAPGALVSAQVGGLLCAGPGLERLSLGAPAPHGSQSGSRVRLGAILVLGSCNIHGSSTLCAHATLPLAKSLSSVGAVLVRTSPQLSLGNDQLRDLWQAAALWLALGGGVFSPHETQQAQLGKFWLWIR